MGAILNVDAVIYGTITNYDRIYAVLISDVAVGAKLRMADTKTGDELWAGEHVAHTPSGGIATTPVGLILTALSTAYNLRAINLYRTSDDLFREMVKSRTSANTGGSGSSSCHRYARSGRGFFR